jgi:hypothetical protein
MALAPLTLAGFTALALSRTAQLGNVIDGISPLCQRRDLPPCRLALIRDP